MMKNLCKSCTEGRNCIILEERVSLICETARRFAPDYDVDQIYAALAGSAEKGDREETKSK